MNYFTTNGNLYRAANKGALVREFVEEQPGEGELLEMFVNDLKEMNLTVASDYFQVLDQVVGEWGEGGLETFKQDCECAGVEYHPRPAKTYIYEHPNAIFKVTLDENDVIDQVFMRTNSNWKSLRANQAKCATFLRHAEEVAAGESFGLYTRIHA